MTTWYAQGDGHFNSIAWNTQADGGGTAGAPARDYVDFAESNGHNVDCVGMGGYYINGTLCIIDTPTTSVNGGSFYSSVMYARETGYWESILWLASPYYTDASNGISINPLSGYTYIHQEFDVDCSNVNTLSATLSDEGTGHWLFPTEPPGLEPCYPDGNGGFVAGWYWVENPDGSRVCQFQDGFTQEPYVVYGTPFKSRTKFLQSSSIGVRLMARSAIIKTRVAFSQSSGISYGIDVSHIPVQVRSVFCGQVVQAVLAAISPAAVRTKFLQGSVVANVGFRATPLRSRTKFLQARRVTVNGGPQAKPIGLRTKFNQGQVYSGNVLTATPMVVRTMITARPDANKVTINATPICVRSGFKQALEAKVFIPREPVYVHSKTESQNVIYGVTGESFKLNKTASSRKRGDKVNVIHLTRAKAQVESITAYFHPESIIGYLAAGDWKYEHPGGYLLIVNEFEENFLLVADPEAEDEYAVRISASNPPEMEIAPIAEG